MKREKRENSQPLDVYKSFKNATICFSMVDLFCKVFIPTQNLSYFHNYIVIKK